jgi:hypothetical protein
VCSLQRDGKAAHFVMDGRLESGDVQDLLRLLHYALLDSSRALAAFLVDKVSHQPLVLYLAIRWRR